MANIGFLITERTLIENSVINENVSMAVVRPTLVKVQEMRIQTIIGSPLYKDLEAKVIAGTLTQALNPVQFTLVEEYIVPCIIQWTYYELPLVLAYRMMNKNMVRRRSEESEVMSTSEMTYWLDKAKNDAEWYSERVTAYLMENRNLFPLYFNPTVALDTIYPASDNYDTGLVMNSGLRRFGYDTHNPYCNDCP
jgi:hypothetical protein